MPLVCKLPMGIIEFLANIQHFGMELPIDFKYKKLHLSATYFSSVEIMPQGDKDYNDEFKIHRNDSKGYKVTNVNSVMALYISFIYTVNITRCTINVEYNSIYASLLIGTY